MKEKISTNKILASTSLVFGILSLFSFVLYFYSANHAPYTYIDVKYIQCLSPAKKYKLYKSSINKSLHFAQRRLSSSTRVQVQRVTAQLNLSRE